jgi:citrate synthase
MLSEDIKSVDRVSDFVVGVKNKKRKLMGFGHRIYKSFDPRATLVQKTAYTVFDILGKEPLVEVAVALEQAALADNYFKDRKLYANVDFYSGLIYRAMGFPTDFFPGWFGAGSREIADQLTFRPQTRQFSSPCLVRQAGCVIGPKEWT